MKRPRRIEQDIISEHNHVRIYEVLTRSSTQSTELVKPIYELKFLNGKKWKNAGVRGNKERAYDLALGILDELDDDVETTSSKRETQRGRVNKDSPEKK